LEEILITEMQARILAALLNEIRPRWSVGSMLKILEKHHQHPAKFVDIALAAVTAARDPSVETPGMFFNDTRFWPEDIKAKLPKPPDCVDHDGQDAYTCRSCKADVLCGDRPPDMIGKHYDPPPEIEALADAGAFVMTKENQ
jgi:hypothetical protein